MYQRGYKMNNKLEKKRKNDWMNNQVRTDWQMKVLSRSQKKYIFDEPKQKGIQDLFTEIKHDKH